MTLNAVEENELVVDVRMTKWKLITRTEFEKADTLSIPKISVNY